MTEYLGIDCANKTLAWSHMTINTSRLDILQEEFIQRVTEFTTVGESSNEKDSINDDILLFLKEFRLKLAEVIVYHSCGVVDILAGKKVVDTDEVTRTRLLRKWLESSPVAQDKLGPDVVILIEHQPPKIGLKMNNKSTLVEHQLVFYYSNFNVVLVNPTVKNTMVFNGITLADYKRTFLTKRKSRQDALYAARKTHSKENFLYFVKVFRLEHLLTGVSKSCYDDLADSSMQIFAFNSNRTNI